MDPEQNIFFPRRRQVESPQAAEAARREAIAKYHFIERRYLENISHQLRRDLNTVEVDDTKWLIYRWMVTQDKYFGAFPGMKYYPPTDVQLISGFSNILETLKQNCSLTPAYQTTVTDAFNTMPHGFYIDMRLADRPIEPGVTRFYRGVQDYVADSRQTAPLIRNGGVSLKDIDDYRLGKIGFYDLVRRSFKRNSHFGSINTVKQTKPWDLSEEEMAMELHHTSLRNTINPSPFLGVTRNPLTAVKEYATTFRNNFGFTGESINMDTFPQRAEFYSGVLVLEIPNEWAKPLQINLPTPDEYVVYGEIRPEWTIGFIPSGHITDPQAFLETIRLLNNQTGGTRRHTSFHSNLFEEYFQLNRQAYQKSQAAGEPRAINREDLVTTKTYDFKEILKDL